MDRMDRAIVGELQANGRISIVGLDEFDAAVWIDGEYLERFTRLRQLAEVREKDPASA